MTMTASKNLHSNLQSKSDLHLARKLWRRWFEKPTASVEPGGVDGANGANGAAKT